MKACRIRTALILAPGDTILTTPTAVNQAPTPHLFVSDQENTGRT
jgi:hypothetical protein